ncbi:MAG: rhomboid family intramembrane serine protease [Rhodocyclaceae bacterium]|nr:rhomboid family intramembrane serine protease [Rhodocyclaceae bacterium]MBX3670566.1 rhomboid family intramembrane serine protease [Rhodocyclaceae bacterium]
MFETIPTVTRALLIANGAAYLMQLLIGNWLVALFALWPPGSGWFMPWQLVTYAFLHGGLYHLLFNCLALYMFGADVERVFGHSRFLNFYFVCVISAAAMQLLFSLLRGGPPVPTVGASGGVFGVLLAFGMLFPNRMILLIFPPIPMKAWVFVTLYGVIELVLGVTGTAAGVAHFAHLGGMLGGFLMLRHYASRRR